MDNAAKKQYAFAEHETVQAMLHTLFRFQTLEQAQMITNKFAQEFTLAPKLSDPLDKKSFVMWVRGLEVTDDQKKLGFLGNFGKISMHQIKGGKWTMTLKKIDVPLNKHPLRKAIPRRHPNMGHPVIRSATRGKTWPTMLEANAQLVKLHEEFPEISVPGLGKLKILTYVKAEKGESPVQRIELQVTKKDEGVYFIDVRKPQRKPQPKFSLHQPTDDEAPVAAVITETAETPAATDGATPTAAPAAGAPKPEAKGFYTNLVTKGRKKKKK